MLCKPRILLLLLSVAMVLCACGTASEEPSVPPETVVVTFQLNNGQPDAVLEVEKGTTVQNPPVPTKPGCEFAGWFQELNPWKLESKPLTEDTVLSAKWKLTPDTFLRSPNAAVRADDTDVRICSFNILSPLRGAKHPLADRPQHFLDTALAYLPDVIGIQEYDEPWHPAFLKAFKNSGYRLVTGQTDTVDGIRTTRELAYRTDRLTLLEHGITDCPISSISYNGRFIWALFETKDTARQKFIVVSLHWYWDDEDARTEESSYLVDWLQQTRAAYGVPIVCVGDYNALETEISYQLLQQRSSLQDAKYAAKELGFIATTYHDRASADSYTETMANSVFSIDHILYTQDIEALYYNTVIDATALCASDHNPIYADLKFRAAS